MNTKNGFFALLGGAVTFSFFGIFIRTLNTMFGSYTQVVLRGLVAMSVAFFLVILKKANFKIPKDKLLPVAMFAISFPLAIIFFTLSVISTKAANSVFTLYIGSLLISFFAGTFFFKEKVNLQKILGMIFVVLGLLSLIFPFDIKLLSGGVIWGLLAGIMEGTTNVLRKYLSKLDRNVILTYQYGTAVILASLMAVFSGQVMLKIFSWQAAVTLVIFGSCLALVGNLLNYGFANFDMNIGTIILSTELFFTLVVNYLFLGEIPLMNELIGGIFIFLAANIVGIDWKSFEKLWKMGKNADMILK